MFYQGELPLVDYLKTATKISSSSKSFFSTITNKEIYIYINIYIYLHIDTMNKNTLICTFCCWFSFLGRIQFSLDIICRVEVRPCDKRIICFIYTLKYIHDSFISKFFIPNIKATNCSYKSLV